MRLRLTRYDESSNLAVYHLASEQDPIYAKYQESGSFLPRLEPYDFSTWSPDYDNSNMAAIEATANYEAEGPQAMLQILGRNFFVCWRCHSGIRI